MNDTPKVAQPTRPIGQFVRETIIEGNERCSAYFGKAVALRMHDTVEDMEVIVMSPNQKALDYFFYQWQRLEGKKWSERAFVLNPKHVADVAIINQSSVKMEDDEL